MEMNLYHSNTKHTRQPSHFKCFLRQTHFTFTVLRTPSGAWFEHRPPFDILLTSVHRNGVKYAIWVSQFNSFNNKLQSLNRLAEILDKVFLLAF
jgi:hypothetical protein